MTSKTYLSKSRAGGRTTPSMALPHLQLFLLQNTMSSNSQTTNQHQRRLGQAFQWAKTTKTLQRLENSHRITQLLVNDANTTQDNNEAVSRLKYFRRERLVQSSSWKFP